jgi:glycosyltransferase involved in cell wall biosynthesis
MNNNEKQIKISIIIPMYNRATLVSETLDSVLAQTCNDWECIVVDDSSTDNSVEVVQKYVDKDSRFKLLIRPEERIKGAPTCRNIGYENSRGEIVIFFDSDDLMSPPYFETVIRLINKNSDVDFAIVPSDSFFESPDKPFAQAKRYSTKLNLIEEILSIRVYAGSSDVVWKRSFLQCNERMWKEGLLKGQDGDFLLKNCAHANKVVFFDMPTMLHSRHHAGQMAMSALNHPEYGEALTTVYTDCYEYICEKGKFTPQIENIYIKTLGLMMAFNSAALYNSSQSCKTIYYFIKEHYPASLDKYFILLKCYLYWKLAPLLNFATNILYDKLRHYRFVRFIKKLVLGR